ncbi:LuxR C-terminal-related transcriptional regulator [Streptomyces sp. NPDC004609]|uniref:LuxR C-terminal-related transcriptional regulator n=1 Tax=Streptomyces sp. NPDC004609 TaxID=3364704 RepID=UPI0036A435DB
MNHAPLPRSVSSRSSARESAAGAAAREGLVSALERRLRSRGTGGALDVLQAAADTLLNAVAADVWCAVMLDPATLLDTGGLHEHSFPRSVMPRLFEIEHADQMGVDNIRALARRADPVSLLSRSTGGRMAESVYYRDVLRPAGLADELRILLRDGARTWGLFVLCRAEGSRPFTPAEVALAGAVRVPAATALRRSLLLSGIDRDDVPDAAGLLIIDDDQRTRLCTATAERWLGLVQEAHPAPGRRVPYALTALVNKVRTTGPGVQVRSRAISRTGQWVTLSAWRESGRGEGTAGGGPGGGDRTHGCEPDSGSGPASSPGSRSGGTELDHPGATGSGGTRPGETGAADPDPGGTGAGPRTGRNRSAEARPGGSGPETLTYVSLAPSTPRELTAIVLDAYGLTPREREVAQHVLLGRSTAEVSAALHIAEYTVQDHLRKVFDKAGVRSRREFSGELFRRCYLPRLDDPPLTKDGRMRGDTPGAAR